MGQPHVLSGVDFYANLRVINRQPFEDLAKSVGFMFIEQFYTTLLQ